MQHIVSEFSEFRQEFTCMNMRETFLSFFSPIKRGGKNPPAPSSNQTKIHPQRFSPPKEKHFHASYLPRLHARPAKPLNIKEGEQSHGPAGRFFFFEGCPAGRSWNPASQEAVRHPLLDRYQDRSGGDTDSKNTRTTERSDEPMRAYGR